MRDGLLRALGIKDERGKEEVREINLADIQANPFQPRKNFGAGELAELAASISEYGVLQPVVVRRREKGYELVAGERRVRAAQMIGLNSVPAMSKTLMTAI
jgi:ParB family chromosome partitioning protein